jgi:Outer membrane protein beta-barrel family/TonB-dependent Receptor Plug Domain
MGLHLISGMMVSALALTGVAYAQTQPSVASTDANTDCSPTPTCAATPPARSGDRVTYEPAFFAQYNPQSALDMVRQIPGFTLNGGDDRRGFSGAVGNLLIDGVRPSSKSQSVDGILSRIPANQVVRLEVLRGAEVAGDASGQATLLNVVRTPTAGSGVWAAGFEHTSRDVFAPHGELSYSGRSGDIDYGIGGTIHSQFRDLPGWRRFYDASGAYTGRAETPSPQDYREVALNGNIAFPLAGGRLSTTSQLDWWRFHSDQGYLFFDASDAPDSSLFRLFEEHRGSYEVGVNYDRDFGPWSLALIGLINRGRYESEENGRTEDGFGGVDQIYAQDVRQDSGESIARATMARALPANQRIEFSGEIAYNSLDQQLRFVTDDGGGPTPLTIPNSNVLVEENRIELSGVHTWRPNSQWTLETRLAWETSTLTFTGDTNSEVELSFWKPSVQLTRSFAGANQVRLRVYRDVGQLNFGDFVSAAAVADDLISGGNPELVPQTDWRAELGGDFQFPGGAALAVTLTRHWFSNVADVVKITIPDPPNPDIVFDAPGNIGDAEETTLNVNFSTPLTMLLPGGRITIEGYLRDNSVTDPVTGQSRIISYRPESQLSVEFRQDLNAQHLAWGVSAFKEGEFQAYRFNEIDTSEEGPWVDLFAETTALPNNMKLRLTAANIFRGTVNRDRRFFAPDRSGMFLSQDLRKRHFDSAPWFTLQLNGTF